MEGGDGLMSEEPPRRVSVAPDNIVAPISLLPRSLIDFFDVAGCPLLSLPLPQSLRVGDKYISLAALNLCRISDLGAVSPLALLTLAESPYPLNDLADGVWLRVLAAAPSLVAPVLEWALAPSLAELFAPPTVASDARTPPRTPPRSPQQRIQPSALRCSALFFAPQEIIEAHFRNWSPDVFGPVTVPDAPFAMECHDGSPEQAMLLSPQAQSALAAAGCDFSLNLYTLKLPVRTVNCCRKARMRTLGDLVSKTPEQLFEARNFGPRSYIDVVSALRTYLAPWLTQLPAALVMGDEDGAEPEADIAHGEPAEPIQPIEPEQPNVPLPAYAANPFATLRDSDLVAALDLFGVSWRDTPVRSLAPETVVRPLEEIAEVDPAARPDPPYAAVPLEEVDSNLRELVQLLAARGLVPTLADIPVGALVDDHPDAAAIAAGIAPERADDILREVVAQLATALLRHMLRPDAFRETCERALVALGGVTVGDLLAELIGAPGVGGAYLTLKETEVLIVRNGLYDGERQTLEVAGQRLGVTRERIRQIEKRACERLEKPQAQPPMQASGGLVALAIRALGGVATVSATATRLGAWIPFGAAHPEATMRFLAEWSPDVTITRDDLLIGQPYTEELVRQIQSLLHDLVLRQDDITQNDVIEQAMFAWVARTDIPWEMRDITVDERFVAAVLATTPHISARDERYHVAGRGGKTQRIIQAMRSLERPAKVAEIGAEYRRLYPDDSQCGDQSIRGFFDRFHDTFVLVGLSTYALAEWGYDPRINTIAALVEHLLAESARPLRREEVVARAVDKYHWKALSVSAQLDTNEHIQKFAGGGFGLRDHVYSYYLLATDSAANGDDERDAREDDKHPQRERLVVGTYTNRLGHRVVQVRLSGRSLGGYLSLTSQPLHETFPDEGKFRAEVWPTTSTGMHLTLSRTSQDVSGFSQLFSATHARAGDALFVERLAGATSDAPAMYRVALAHANDLAGAMDAVGLTGDADGATTSDIPVLHDVRKPHRLIRLIEHATEHPWMALDDASFALNCAPRNPAAWEYLQLAQMTGLVATGQPTAGGPTIVRPTTLGRRWAFTPDSAWGRARALALSLPAYRAHVRALGGGSLASERLDAEMQRLGVKTLGAWDRICGMTPGASAIRALEESAALLSSDLLPDPALPLLLLLLMAQMQGRGLALSALDDALGGQARAALGRLRALGLAVAEDDAARIALAERARLAVVSPARVAATLRIAIGDEGIASAMIKAWVNVLRMLAHRPTLRASDLYDELHALAPDFLYTALVTPPDGVPEYALDVDMELPFCGFPALTDDWALAPVDVASPGDGEYQTMVSHDSGDTTSAAPIGVALCDDLLSQPWSVERHLAGNAHLALLVVIAADEERLAEHLARDERGWRLAGDALVATLDTLLGALGYDVWNEPYRCDPGQQTRLGDALVALAERFHLVEADGARLEAVSGPATRLYYEACDRGFVERITATLVAALALA